MALAIHLALHAADSLSAKAGSVPDTEQPTKSWIAMMSNQWIAPESCPSLAVLVETVTAPLLIQHSAPICLEMDIEHTLEIPADPGQTAELIRAIVAQMLDEMPSGGELMVTAVESVGCIQLGFADTGGSVDGRARRIPMAAAAIGAKLDWHDGSQGGAVINVTFNRRSRSGRRAA